MVCVVLALKVDIDSIDAEVLTAILDGGFRPKVRIRGSAISYSAILPAHSHMAFLNARMRFTTNLCVQQVLMAEFNPDVPPPFRWARKHNSVPIVVDANACGGSHCGFFGASADELFAIASAFDYALVGVEYGTNDHRSEGGEYQKCLACEHNVWFVDARYWKHGGRGRIPTWHDLVAEWWEARYAFTLNTSPGKLSRPPGCAHGARLYGKKSKAVDCALGSILEWTKAIPLNRAHLEEPGFDALSHGGGWKEYKMRSLALATRSMWDTSQTSEGEIAKMVQEVANRVDATIKRNAGCKEATGCASHVAVSGEE